MLNKETQEFNLFTNLPKNFAQEETCLADTDLENLGNGLQGIHPLGQLDMLVRGSMLEGEFLPFTNSILFVGSVDFRSMEIFTYEQVNDCNLQQKSQGLYIIDLGNRQGSKDPNKPYTIRKIKDMPYSKDYTIFAGSIIFVYILKDHEKNSKYIGEFYDLYLFDQTLETL